MEEAVQPRGGSTRRPQKTEAIIEDARQRARRRRVGAAVALIVLAAAALVVVYALPGDAPQDPAASGVTASAPGSEQCLAALGLTQADSSRIPVGVNPCDVSPVGAPNRIGSFPSEARLQQCAGTASREGLMPPADPFLCKVVKAQKLGLVVPGEELSKAELSDVLSRAVRNKGLSVRALSADPLLDACLHKLGNGKPTLPPCEWALAHGPDIQQAG